MTGEERDYVQAELVKLLQGITVDLGALTGFVGRNPEAVRAYVLALDSFRSLLGGLGGAK